MMHAQEISSHNSFDAIFQCGAPESIKSESHTGIDSNKCQPAINYGNVHATQARMLLNPHRLTILL